MTKMVVLDASALLALLKQEPGYELVAKHLPEAIMSAINVSETVAILHDTGIAQTECEKIIDELISEIIPFDKEQAYSAASLKKQTKSLGLSLGDRACLALGKFKNLPILSADKIWAKLNLDLEIHIIR